MAKNIDKVMADAKKIAERLRSTSTTLTQLQKEYHCGHARLTCSVRSQISAREWKKIRKKKLTHGNHDGGTRFKKGHIAWNKGVRGVHFSPATEFKKGHLPIGYKQVNTVTVRKDTDGKEFRWIKISNVPKSKHTWIPYASYVWQKKNGLIPKGYFIVHADGDRLNDGIDNLQMVDRKGHLELQQKRDPTMVERMRYNSSQTNRRRHIHNRIKKARAAKQSAISGGIISDGWECISCGQDYPGEPPAVCHKCNGFRFSLVKVRQIA